MKRMTRWFYLMRLRALQIALHDADLTDNRDLARRIAPQEARLRATLETL